VLNLRQDVGALSDKLDELMASKEAHTTPPKVFDAGALEAGFLPSTSLGLSLHQASPGQHDLHLASLHRSDGFGVVTTLTPPPVKGTSKIPPPEVFHTPVIHAQDPYWASYQSRLAATLPQLNFPQFDGHHPKMWKAKSENYFDVFIVPRELWVKIATMHFVGSAAFSLQSSDPVLRLAPWSEFCAAVCARFERDQHNSLIRQFFHITQSDTVTEYIEQFDTLMHQILAHDPQFSVSAIVNRFIDGLAPEIRAIVLIHRPIDLDTAVSLALLQEELAQPLVSPSSNRLNDSSTHKSVYRQFEHTTSSPPAAVGQGMQKHTSPDFRKRGQDDLKGAALMAYRKAKGLCYKCGLRWNPTQQCSATVPLHIVEELWQLLETDEAPVENKTTSEDSGDDLMVLSVHVVQGTEAPQTVKLTAQLFTKKIIMLVDYGSSSSFISQPLAKLGPNIIPLSQPVQVQVANGQIISCTHYLPQCKITLQGHTFHLNLKVLPL
jgi:hypothetical protein